MKRSLIPLADRMWAAYRKVDTEEGKLSWRECKEGRAIRCFEAMVEAAAAFYREKEHGCAAKTNS